jgi:hypothetical protein
MSGELLFAQKAYRNRTENIVVNFDENQALEYLQGANKRQLNFTEIDSDSVSLYARRTIKSVWELNQDSVFYLWHGGEVMFLNFTQDKVHFDFSTSCGYWYETQIVDDRKMVFNWDYNASCSYDFGMEKTFGLSRTPVVGEPFGEFVLVNDTLMQVNYIYPEWVERINRHRNAEVFPTTFVLDPRVFGK